MDYTGLNTWLLDFIQVIKGTVTLKLSIFHYLLSLKSFWTCMILFLLQNTKYILLSTSTVWTNFHFQNIYLCFAEETREGKQMMVILGELSL